MKNKNITKTTFFIILAACFTIILSPASHARWSDQNQISVDSLTVSRPSERWRVLQNVESDLLQFKYLRHGQDILIRIFKKDALTRKLATYIAQQHYWEKKNEKYLTKTYQQDGFRIVEFKKDDHQINAIGVDKDRRYLLLNFKFTGSTLHSNIIVTETILENGDYLKFRDDYYSIVKSISINK